MFDVDKLLAEAETAAKEAQRQADQGEIVSAKVSKKKSAEMAERAEELQRTVAGYAATDAGVEDFYYEDIFKYAETVTGVASPEKIKALLENLRKVGTGLSKFAGVEVKSTAFIDKMEELEAVHARLFAEVQTLVGDTLESLKKKFKGEESAFEARYKMLTDSPLVKGIVYDMDSPERRVEGLKQEIVELFMRPLVEVRLKVFEKQLAELTKKSQDFLEDLGKIDAGPFAYHEEDRERKARYDGERLVKKYGPQGNDIQSGLNSLMSVDSLKAWFKEEIPVSKTRISGEKLALDVNRSIIDMILAEAKDETELTEVLKQLKKYVQSSREKVENKGCYDISVYWSPRGDVGPISLPETVLAKKVLGYLELFGSPMPASGDDREWSISEQILGRSMHGYQYGNRRGDLDFDAYLSTRGRRAFLETTGINEGTDEEMGRRAFPKSREEIVPQQIGSGIFWNLKRAYSRVNGSRELSALPQQLVEAGWIVSKLGAFVEPGQDVRVVDREYSKLLERLSEPQITAERAFDVRTPEGDFHVYSTEQGVDLLRRARRDAQAVLEATEKAIMETQGEVGARDRDLGQTKAQLEAQRGEMTDTVGRIRQKQAEIQAAHVEALKKRDEEIKSLQEGIRTLQTEMTGVKSQLRSSRAEAKDAEAKMRKRAETLKVVAEKLQEALATKPGLLGGDKALRGMMEELSKTLRST